MSFFYLLTGTQEERELAALERWVLSGVDAAGPLAEGPVAVDLTGAAYQRLVGRTLARGEDLGQLVEELRVQALEVEGFAVEVYRPSRPLADPATARRPQDWRRVTESVRRITLAVADAVRGRPDLDHPRVRLVVAALPGQWWVGEAVSAADRGWAGLASPYQYSAALPARMARGLVNLVAAPGDRLLDPCCGMGTVVVQAAARGVQAVGVEIARKLAWQATQWVRQSAPGARIVCGDGRSFRGRFDAAVVDLPYGRVSRVSEGLYADLLGNLRGQARRAAIVAACPLNDLLAECGWRVLRGARVYCGSVTRHVHLAVSGEPAGNLTGPTGF